MAGRSPNTEPIAQAQIDALGKQIDSGFSEVKGLLVGYEKRLRDVEQNEARCQPTLSGRILAIEEKQKEYNETQAKHDETIKKLVLVSNSLENISKWLLGIFTALVVIVVGAYLTGGITIVFNH